MRAIQVTVSDAPRVGRRGMSRPRIPRGVAPKTAKPADAARAVRRVLKHAPMPAGQQALLNALYEAGDEGLSTSELAALLSRNEQQLNRLLARLARRIRRTPDVTILQRPGIMLLFDITPGEGQWRYKLRRAARNALAGQHSDWAERQGESATDAA